MEQSATCVKRTSQRHSHNLPWLPGPDSAIFDLPLAFVVVSTSDLVGTKGLLEEAVEVVERLVVEDRHRELAVTEVSAVDSRRGCGSSALSNF